MGIKQRLIPLTHTMKTQQKYKKPKVLIYDIETAPNLGYYFNLYQEGNIIETLKDWYMLSFAYKWLGEKKIYVKSLPDYKTYKKDKENDVELIKDLWELFDQADIVIAHNGNSFDQKKSSARFIKHNLLPPSPYKEIDTKLVAKRYFKFDSNKLDDLGQYLGVGRKLPTTGKATWLGCMSGDMKSWAVMCKYNIQDVVLLEKVYEKLKPWMRNHPNMAVLSGKIDGCPICSSIRVQKRGVWFKKGVNKLIEIQKYQCVDCGGWFSDKVKEDVSRKKDGVCTPKVNTRGKGRTNKARRK